MRHKTPEKGQKGGNTAFFGKKMLLFSIVFFSVFAPYGQGASAQHAVASERLFSPTVSQKFYETAADLVDSNDPSIEEKREAMLFLLAAAELDGSAGHIYPDMLELASSLDRPVFATNAAAPNEGQPDMFTAENGFEMVKTIVRDYIDKSSDIEPTRKAIRYLLESLDEREQRERLLGELLKQIKGKNAAVESELATLLGLLTAEKADTAAATSYFMTAYDKNKYNGLAFAKLVELMSKQIGAASYLEHLRILLIENPLDTEAALGFSRYAQGLRLYETAEGAYQYCADLYEYLNPSEPLPASIYLPWAISCYNSRRYVHKALSIAEGIRDQGHFDIFLETIAAKAAEKAGDSELSKQILSSARDKALQDGLTEQRLEDYQRLAWFYCFASADKDKAVDWANKAYSVEPNSVASAALLAYALAINGQAKWGKGLIEDYQGDPLVELARARIQMQSGEAAGAVETLRTVIESSPGSIEAVLAEELLARNGSEYVPASDPGVILAAVGNNSEYKLVPEFRPPSEAVAVELNLRGTKFSYASELDGTIAITNKSSQPIIITDNSLIRGDIRIDARITGDLQAEIPRLFSRTLRPSSPVKPGGSYLVPVRLLRGRLRRILMSSPQASLQIEFTAVLEPVVGGDGTVSSALGIVAARVQVSRPGVEINTKFLQNRLDSLSKGRQGQKIRTARLFAGLLAEQHKFSSTEPLYRFMYAAWMPQLLKSAIVYNLTSDDWVVRVHTMADILNVPLDYEMINAVTKSLNDTDCWPGRLMAIYLLSRSQAGNFAGVLEWKSKNDPNKLVRNMASILAAAQNDNRPRAASVHHNHIKNR